jgi:SAM-dependent methyltransferase
MPTSGELTYYERIGPDGRAHAQNKPFSDDGRGALLMEVGAVFLLLPPPPCRILECGCGSGWLSYLLAKSGYDVVGQDVNAKAVELARNHPMSCDLAPPPAFVQSDFGQLPFDNEFDAVIFFDSLHHSIDMQLVIASAFRALKHGGMLIASEPGCGHAAKSREFVRKWDVTDRDSPPSFVRALGRASGFSAGYIYPHANTLGSALYESSPGPLAWFGRLLRIVYHASFLARRNGLVVLVK